MSSEQKQLDEAQVFPVPTNKNKLKVTGKENVSMPRKDDSRGKLLVEDIDTTVGSGTVKDILTTQIFAPYLDDNDRKRAQNAKSLDEIWNVCGPKICALDFEKLCRKIFKAMKSKCNNDENHEKVRKLREVLKKYCKTFLPTSSTCAEEEAGDDHLEGNSTHPRKPIDQKSSQVREDGTSSELLQDTQEATTSEGATTLDTNVTSKLLPPSKYYEVARQATTPKEKEELVKIESKPVLLLIDRGEYANGICVSRLCKPSDGEIVTGVTVGKI